MHKGMLLTTTGLLAALVGCGGAGEGGGEKAAAQPAPATTPAGARSTAPHEAPTDPATAQAKTPRGPEPAPPAVVPADEPPVAMTPSPITFELSSDGLPEKGMWKCDPVFVDVNGDGNLDLTAIPRLGDGPHVWLGNGRGDWTESSQGLRTREQSCGGGISVNDANGDGFVDLLVADHCNGVFVYLGDGKGHWQLVTEGLYPEPVVPTEGRTRMYLGAEDITSGDINGDGFIDIIASSSDEGGINAYLGDGTGRNWQWAPDSLPKVGWANRVVLADVSGDGKLDLVASYDEGPRVWHGDGAADWEYASTGLPTPSIRGLYTAVAVGDLNEDGRLDIAVANWIDGPEAYLQTKEGFWEKTTDVFPKMLGGAIGLALGDLDRDGHLDLVVSGRLGTDGGYVRGVFALRGNGAGTSWEYLEGSGLPRMGLAATPGIALGDVDGDDLADVAATSGLLVESVPGATAPVIPKNVMVWLTRLTSTAAVAPRD